ncbi:phosphotransferase [Streptomyces sp. NPDC001480]|uniref:phosphotransferase n=1 Tax=Streptomyces sp. NPDC001480 TaxID=3364577 RepID=UPI00367D7E1B
MSEADVARVLADYGLPVRRVWPLTGGMENTHVRVESPGGDVVLTVLRKKTREEAEHYARFLRDLAGTGAPVPRLRARHDGGWVSAHKGRPVIVCDHVPGRSLERLTPDLVYEAGVILGGIHRGAAGIDSPLPPSLRLTAGEAQAMAALPEGPFAEWATSTHRAVWQVLDRPGPRVPVHADLFPDNIIVRPDNGLVFIDWEDGSLDLPYLDIGMAVLGLCGGSVFSVRDAGRLLRGYQEGSGSDLDLEAVRDAALHAAVLTALRRYRWHRNGHVSVHPLRSHADMQALAESLAERWDAVRP